MIQRGCDPCKGRGRGKNGGGRKDAAHRYLSETEDSIESTGIVINPGKGCNKDSSTYSKEVAYSEYTVSPDEETDEVTHRSDWHHQTSTDRCEDDKCESEKCDKRCKRECNDKFSCGCWFIYHTSKCGDKYVSKVDSAMSVSSLECSIAIFNNDLAGLFNSGTAPNPISIYQLQMLGWFSDSTSITYFGNPIQAAVGVDESAALFYAIFSQIKSDHPNATLNIVYKYRPTSNTTAHITYTFTFNWTTNGVPGMSQLVIDTSSHVVHCGLSTPKIDSATIVTRGSVA